VKAVLEGIMMNLVLPDLRAAGFIVNVKKTMTEAQRQAKYLGMLIDSVAGHISVPEPKWIALMALVATAISTASHCDIQLLQVITGTISSMHWSFGPIARLESMSLHASMLGAGVKAKFVSLSQKALDNLLFWRDKAQPFNGHRTLWPDRGHDIIVHTDAAGNNRHHAGGWAGWARINGERAIAKGAWPMEDWRSLSVQGASSSFLEILAIFMVIITLNERGALRGQRLLIMTDSQVADVVITKAGSRAQDIHEAFRDLWWYCHKHAISIQSSWIPRDRNQIADYYSKRIDWSDIRLEHTIFLDLQYAWDMLFDTDLFASHESRQTHRFYSFFWTPGNSGVDAFTQLWGAGSFAFPPYKLISRVLDEAKRQKSQGLCLIIPHWPLATWWNKLTENGLEFRREVTRCVVLPRWSPSGFPLLSPGPSNSLDKWREPKWDTMALLLEFPGPAVGFAPIRVPQRTEAGLIGPYLYEI
jgi:hypothetical protein